jgi:hypothetical protein
MLIDNIGNGNKINYHELFYNFDISEEDLRMIRNQAAKLVRHSKNLDAWTASGYSDIVSMANSETLASLRQYWLQYFTPANSSESRREAFKKGAEETYGPSEARNELYDLRKNFGALTLKSTAIAEDSAQLFCMEVSTDLAPGSPKLNPLFVYPRGLHPAFALDSTSNPKAGFHFASTICQLMPDSPFKGVETAPMPSMRMDGKELIEFVSWCGNFQNCVKDSRDEDSEISLHIQVFVGDPLAFCFALQQLRTKSHSNILGCYVQAESGTALVLNGPCYDPVSPKYRAPLAFNVVDTNDLIDSDGLLNVLVAVIPILEETPASVLYTDTTYSPKTESSLLSDLLAADVRVMSTLLGVAPLAYLTGCTTRGYQQDVPSPVTSSTRLYNRIAWKFSPGGDEAGKLQSTLQCNPEEMVESLSCLYYKMLPDERPTPDTHEPKRTDTRLYPWLYTKRGFAAFLAFLKSRICTDWKKVCHSLVSRIQLSPMGEYGIQEVWVELYLMGVLDRLVTRSLAEDTKYNALQTDSRVTCIVVSIPRSELQTFHNQHLVLLEKSQSPLHVAALLLLDIDGHPHSKFASTVSTFGTLKIHSDGHNGVLEPDQRGWEGSSDLHVFALVPTEMLNSISPEKSTVTIRFIMDSCSPSSDLVATKDFDAFKVSLLADNVHLLESYPGINAPSPKTIENPSKFAVSNDKFQVTYPQLSISEMCFYIQLKFFKTKVKPLVKRGEALFTKKITPCTFTMQYGSFEYCFSFPFPVLGERCSYQISSEHDAIQVEVKVTLWSPSFRESGYYLNPFPIVRQKETVCNWNMPFIYFQILPQLDAGRLNDRDWLNQHLASMFSDQERRMSHSAGNSGLIAFKRSLQQFFSNLCGFRERLKTFEVKSTPLSPASIWIFVTGLFLEDTSHSVSAQAYVFYLPSISPSLTPFVNAVSRNPTKLIVGENGMKFWKLMLPSMVERARRWEHKNDCIYDEGIPRTDIVEGTPIIMSGEPPYCYCGYGKIYKMLIDSKIGDIGAALTHVAISPIFAAPFVELITRSRQEDEESNRATDREGEENCKVCGAKGSKKCGKCMAAIYCSRDCQTKDWKKHKNECKTNS